MRRPAQWSQSQSRIGAATVADWPGLKETGLHENRDLKPATDLPAVLKGLLRDRLRLDDRRLAVGVFPGRDDVRAIGGLVELVVDWRIG